jgi:hypothetical protein
MSLKVKPSLRTASGTIELGDDLTSAPASPNVAGPAALALVTALLQALRDRGVLSRDEIDDVLADAASRVDYGSPSLLIARVRTALEQRGEDGE